MAAPEQQGIGACARNIAELLQDKIVRRVAADRRTELLASVHDSMDKLRAREATLVQLVAWMDEHEETQRQITARQQDFMAAKEEEELVVQVSGCVSEQLALTSTTQLDSARGSAAQVQQQIEAQVERWFHTSYGESSATQQATVDGEKFNIRSLAMPFHDFFDGPASTAFGAAFDDLAAQRPKIVAACEAKAAASKGGSAKRPVARQTSGSRGAPKAGAAARRLRAAPNNQYDLAERYFHPRSYNQTRSKSFHAS